MDSDFGVKTIDFEFWTQACQFQIDHRHTHRQSEIRLGLVELRLRSKKCLILLLLIHPD